MGAATTLAGVRELDPDESRRLLESLAQGEVIRLGRAPRVVATAHPLDPDEVRAAGLDSTDQPIASLDLRLDPELGAIVSQDCDLVRDIGREPYVLVAALTRVSNDLYSDVTRNGSSRFFAYPSVDGNANLVLDMRLVLSVEKPAVFSPAIERLGCPLTEPQRSQLRAWLGARFARVAFPDEIAGLVVLPIGEAVASLSKDANFARALAAVRFSGLRYTVGLGDCSLLLLIDPAAANRLKVDESVFNSLQKKLHGRIHGGTKDTGYRVSVSIRSADGVSALDMLSHHAVPLGDLDDDGGTA